MITKAVVQHLAQALIIILVIQSSTCWAADDPDEKISKFVSNAALKIGGTNHIGTTITKNWSETPEVKDVAAFKANKRAAILWKSLDHFQHNEDKIFPNIKTNGDQLVIAIITRILFLTHLNTLISSAEDNDVVIKGYLDGEITDLKLVLNGKKNNIVYENYLQWRKMRDDKLARIFLTDKKLLTEHIRLIRNNDNIAQVITNKTFLISLLEACVQNQDICVKL